MYKINARVLMRGVMYFVIGLFVISLYFLFGNLRQDVVPTSLESVEVDNYEGQDLSSVYDFRENSIRGVQYVDVENYVLRVGGLVEEEKVYSYDEVIDRPSYSKVVTLNCVEGWSATILWEGIILRDLLSEARPLMEANTIIFHAVDGYTTSYPIEYIMDQDILMAYKMNGEKIIPERGFPFQLVAEDKWGYKWIKWIDGIEFSDDEDYRGYWESRGYSNSGNLNERFFE